MHGQNMHHRIPAGAVHPGAQPIRGHPCFALNKGVAIGGTRFLNLGPDLRNLEPCLPQRGHPHPGASLAPPVQQAQISHFAHGPIYSSARTAKLGGKFDFTGQKRAGPPGAISDPAQDRGFDFAKGGFLCHVVLDPLMSAFNKFRSAHKARSPHLFRIIRPDDLPAIPWKNGGGVTREIAKAEDGQGLIWRISVADVDVDGPFSRFEGLTRILTVIAGVGIDLICPGGTINARWGEPVRFSGELPVTGRLTDGPIRDLNLIFDAIRVSADVQLLDGNATYMTGTGPMGCLGLAGTVRVDGLLLPIGAFAFGSAGQIELDPGAKALLVTIHELK
jgi:uncharacterized protein